MKKIVLLMCMCITALAQNPKASSKQIGQILFVNATIHVGDGSIINNGGLLIENGLIKEVGEMSKFSNFGSATTVDLKGKKIFPGIISPNNALGLTEIESVRSMSDEAEIGEYNPNLRTLIAYNTDSEIIPTVRGNGILITQATPEGGVISGRSSIMNLDGWNWEDAVLKADDGLWLNWPSRKSFNNETKEIEKNKKYQSQIDELILFFKQANGFSNSNDPVNLKLNALHNVLANNSRVFINFEQDKEAIDAIQFCKANAIKYPVLVGEVSSNMLIALLKENSIPILIPATHRLPSNQDDDIWAAYKLPARLFDAGLTVGMYYNASQWRTRNLPFVAGTAAAYGLSKANALKMICLNNAKILGIDNLVGSLEKGKQATFVVSEGDILDMKSSKISNIYIKGAEVSLDNKQKRLSDKYFEKYGIK